MENKKILIVDDEALILDKVTKILSASFENILTATNGVEALDVIAKNNDLCCVVTDIRMPEMDGIELIKAARSQGEEVPFIIFTSHGDDQLMKEAIKHGVFDFIDKPLFANLSDSVLRGVKEGFALKNNSETDSEERVISEYESLLADSDD